MEESLFALQSAEMFTWRAFGIAVGIAGGDVEAIQHAQPVFQVRGRIRSPGLWWQGRPEAAQGVAPDLLPSARFRPLRAFSTAWWAAKQAHAWRPDCIDSSACSRSLRAWSSQSVDRSAKAATRSPPNLGA